MLWGIMLNTDVPLVFLKHGGIQVLYFNRQNSLKPFAAGEGK